MPDDLWKSLLAASDAYVSKLEGNFGALGDFNTRAAQLKEWLDDKRNMLNMLGDVVCDRTVLATQSQQVEVSYCVRIIVLTIFNLPWSEYIRLDEKVSHVLIQNALKISIRHLSQHNKCHQAPWTRYFTHACTRLLER